MMLYHVRRWLGTRHFVIFYHAKPTALETLSTFSQSLCADTLWHTFSTVSTTLPALTLTAYIWTLHAITALLDRASQKLRLHGLKTSCWSISYVPLQNTSSSLEASDTGEEEYMSDTMRVILWKNTRIELHVYLNMKVWASLGCVDIPQQWWGPAVCLSGPWLNTHSVLMTVVLVAMCFLLIIYGFQLSCCWRWNQTVWIYLYSTILTNT